MRFTSILSSICNHVLKNFEMRIENSAGAGQSYYVLIRIHLCTLYNVQLYTVCCQWLVGRCAGGIRRYRYFVHGERNKLYKSNTMRSHT